MGRIAAQVDEDAGHHCNRDDDENVFEVTRREMLVHDLAHLDEQSQAEPVAERRVEIPAFFHEEPHGQPEQRQKHRQLAGRHFEIVTGLQTAELSLKGRTLRLHLLLQVPLPVFQRSQLLVQRGDLIVDLLVPCLVGQKEALTLRQRLRPFRRGGLALLQGELLQLKQLVHRLLRVAGTVAHDALPLLAVVRGPLDFVNLVLNRGGLLGQLGIAEPRLDLLILGAGPGANVPHEETQQPVDQDAEENGEKVNQQAVKDCRVSVDGAPTIFCFHASCAPAVAEANQRLRRELSAAPWALTLPGGTVLRSGDVLQGDGSVKTRAEILGRTSSGLRPPSPQSGEGMAHERLVLETVRVMAERFAPELFEMFHWPFAQIIEDSPLLVAVIRRCSHIRNRCGCRARIATENCSGWFGSRIETTDERR